MRSLLCYGSNWYSISHKLVNYVNENRIKVEKLLNYTFAPDECWLQTLVYDSPFFEHVYNKNMDDDYSSSLRAIDWKRGNPYVWRKEDFSYLMDSDFLFARKFDPSIDNEIITMISDAISSSKNGNSKK